MLVSRLVFLLVYRRKSNLFCLLVKRTLKPLTPGEVARFTVTERALQEQASQTVWSNFFFQAKKKEAKKSLATTTATVSQAPQRFQVREKTNACYFTVGTDVLGCPIVVLSFTVGTDVLGCPIVVLSKSKRDSINRTISFCIIKMTSSRGEGLPPPAVTQSRKKNADLSPLFFSINISTFLFI